MLLYALTLTGIAALMAVAWLRRTCEPGTYPYVVSRRLKLFLGTLVLVALVCSALQAALLLPNGNEAAARTLGQLERRLVLYRGLSRVFTLTGFQTAALCLSLGALFVAAFAGPKQSILRSVAAWKAAYVSAAAAALLGLFGSLIVDTDAFIERFAAIERHVKRIEQRYVDLVARATERLDLRLAASVLSALDQDPAWGTIEAIWRGATRDMAQLRSAYPNLYVAFEKTATSHFPAAPLIAIPERIRPVSAAAVSAGSDVRLERFTALFAASSEDIVPLQVARGQWVAVAIAPTRRSWSQQRASALEKDLIGAPDPLVNDRGNLAWKLSQRLGVAMYEQADPQDGSLQEWSGLPWRFVKIFLDASVDDQARDHLAGSAQSALVAWLSGQKDWPRAASDYAREVEAQLRAGAQATGNAGHPAAVPAVNQAAAEYAAARAQLNEDVHRYGTKASAQRWLALQQTWVRGASLLPPASRDSALKVLARIRQAVEAQKGAMPRLALLARMEEAWRSAVGFAGEDPQAVFQNVAAAVIVAESLTLGSRRFADENREALLSVMREAVRERFGESAGRTPKLSETYKLDAYLKQVFLDSGALTAAALQRLSRNTDRAHAPRLLAQSSKECAIEGDLSMSTMREGWVEARSVQPLSLPCW